MSAAGKLAGFAVLLLFVFGGAVAAGGAIGPDRDGSDPAPAEDTMPGHGGEHAGEEVPDPVRGLAVSEGGLTLALRRTELPRDRSAELRFSIVGSDGQPVRDLEVAHEKRMHLIVVRRDGQGFQHLHPELGDDGVWHVRLTLSAAGALRAGREAELRFSVTRDGEAVRTEPYLGAGGHLVALREGDLAYLHVHPDEHGEAISFMTEFPSEGRYRLYLQFKHDGHVHTAEFTREVAR